MAQPYDFTVETVDGILAVQMEAMLQHFSACTVAHGGSRIDLAKFLLYDDKSV